MGRKKATAVNVATIDSGQQSPTPPVEAIAPATPAIVETRFVERVNDKLSELLVLVREGRDVAEAESGRDGSEEKRKSWKHALAAWERAVADLMMARADIREAVGYERGGR